MDIKSLLGEKFTDGMTAEELISALSEIDVDDGKDEINKLRNSLSKANSEAAGYKKKLNEFLSEDELKKKETEDLIAELKQANAILQRNQDISAYKANYLDLGFDSATATKAAEAMVDGKSDEVFGYMKKFKETLAKNLRAEIMKDIPDPQKDGNSDTMTLEKFRKLSFSDRAKFAAENPDAYNNLYGDGK